MEILPVVAGNLPGTWAGIEAQDANNPCVTPHQIQIDVKNAALFVKGVIPESMALKPEPAGLKAINHQIIGDVGTHATLENLVIRFPASMERYMAIALRAEGKVGEPTNLGRLWVRDFKVDPDLKSAPIYEFDIFDGDKLVTSGMILPTSWDLNRQAPRRCVACGYVYDAAAGEIEFAPDPYADEINHNGECVWECTGCRKESCKEI